MAVIRFLVPQTTTSPSIEVFLCLLYHRERQKKLPNANSIDQGKHYMAVLTIAPIHAAAMMNKKRGLAGRFTANLRVST